MALPRWALPEYFEDVLPVEAERLEFLRRRVLDQFRAYGYQLVIPPCVEHLDSLVSGAGHDMADSTFKLVDQLSGRTLGLRADTTPQVTRIDAHLLNRSGVARLCYCGSVVHTLPRSQTTGREQIQIGAELYGHAGIEADEEVIRLLAHTLELAQATTSRIDVSHMGLFRALCEFAQLDKAAEELLFGILQTKDVPALREFVLNVPEQARAALLALPDLYGDKSVLDRAVAVLPDVAGVRQALEDLQHLARRLHDLPLSFDLADLRGYHYHTGLMFAAYCAASPAAVALGGRYNEVGKAFGRARPATGFSLDLRVLALMAPAITPCGAILAPQVSEDASLAAAVQKLRNEGEIVLQELPGHEGSWSESGCDRKLIKQGNAWSIVPFKGE